MSLKLYIYDRSWAGVCIVAAHSKEEAIEKFADNAGWMRSNDRERVEECVEEFEFNENFGYENLGDS